MSTPIATDDLAQGASTWLATFPDVLAVLGVNDDDVPLLFQNTPFGRIECTQSTALVLSQMGGWAGPNDFNTMRFPRLSVEIYVDPLRDSMNNPIDPGEAHRRASNAFNVIDRRLHRPQSGVQMWGTVRTIACLRLGEPNVFGVPGGDGMLRLHVFYGVTQG